MDMGALLAALLLLPWMAVMVLLHPRMPNRNSAALIGLGLVLLGIANAALIPLSVVPVLSAVVSSAAVGVGALMLFNSRVPTE